MPSALDLLSAAALLDQPTAAAAVAFAADEPTIATGQLQQQQHYAPPPAAAASSLPLAQHGHLADIARAVINFPPTAAPSSATSSLVSLQGRQRVPSSSGSTGLFAQQPQHATTTLPHQPGISLPPLPALSSDSASSAHQALPAVLGASPPASATAVVTHSHGTRRQAREQQQQQQQQLASRQPLQFYTASDGTAHLGRTAVPPPPPPPATGLPPLPALPLPSTLPPLPTLPGAPTSISPLPTYHSTSSQASGIGSPHSGPPPFHPSLSSSSKPKRPPPSYAVPAESGLIRCVCPYSVDDGFTIQCDLCNVWQHAACVGIPSLVDVPDEYWCERCDPVGARERGVDGRLAEVGMRVRMREMERVQEQIRRAEALQAQHHQEWLLLASEREREREAAIVEGQRGSSQVQSQQGGLASASFGGQQQVGAATTTAAAAAAAAAAAKAALDDDPDFTLHSSTPRSRPKSNKPRRSGGGGASSVHATPTAAPLPASSTAAHATTGQSTSTSSAAKAAAAALANVTASPRAQLQQQQQRSSEMTTTTTTTSPKRAGPEFDRANSNGHADAAVRVGDDGDTVMSTSDEKKATFVNEVDEAGSTKHHGPEASSKPPPPPPTVPTKNPVSVGRKRRVAKQPKSRATSTGGEATDDGVPVSLSSGSLPTEPADGGSRLSSLRDRERTARNASNSASAQDESGLSSDDDERPSTVAITSRSERHSRNAVANDEDDRYDAWQYEFTPIEANLYPDAALLDHLERVLSQPAGAALEQANETGSSVWHSLRERQDAMRGSAGGKTGAKVVEALLDLQPTYVELPMLPPTGPIAVKPIPLSATTMSQPPIQNAYIPTPYSASLHASSAAAQAMCPFPRPKSFALFATAPIAAGSFVTEYSGTIRDLETYRADPINQYPLAGTLKGAVRALPHPWSLVVDARQFGNEARFARSGCRPNAVLRVVKVEAGSTATAAAPNKRRQKRSGSPAKGRSRSTTPLPGANAGASDGPQWAAQRSGHPAAESFRVAIFALTDIHKRDEIVLPWDWDDAHLIHLLPSLLALPSSVASPSLLESLSEHLDAAANLSRAMAAVADVVLAPASSSLNGGCACERKKECAVWWLARGGAASCFSLTAKGGGGRATQDVGIAFLNAFAGANGRDKEGVDPSVAKRKAGSTTQARQIDLGALVGLERGWIVAEPVKAEAHSRNVDLAAVSDVEQEAGVSDSDDAMSVDDVDVAEEKPVALGKADAISPSSALTSLPSDDAPHPRSVSSTARPPRDAPVPVEYGRADDSDSSDLTEPLSNLSALEDDADSDDDLSEPDETVLSPPLLSKAGSALPRLPSPAPAPPKKRPTARKASATDKSEAAASTRSSLSPKPQQDKSATKVKARSKSSGPKKRKVARVYSSSSESEREAVSQTSSQPASRAMSEDIEAKPDRAPVSAAASDETARTTGRSKKRPASSTPHGLAVLKIRKVKKRSSQRASDESDAETSPAAGVAARRDDGSLDQEDPREDAEMASAQRNEPVLAPTATQGASTAETGALSREQPPVPTPVQPAPPPPPPPVRSRLSFAEYRQRQMRPPPPPPPPPLAAVSSANTTPAIVATVAGPTVPATQPAVATAPAPVATQAASASPVPAAHPLAGVTAAQLEALAGALAAASSSPSMTPTTSLAALGTAVPTPSPASQSRLLPSETPPLPQAFLRRAPPPPPPPAARDGSSTARRLSTDSRLLGPMPISQHQVAADGTSRAGDDEPEAGTPPLPPQRDPEPISDASMLPPVSEKEAPPGSGQLSAADILKSIGDYFGSSSGTPPIARPARQLAADAAAAGQSPSAVSQGTPPFPPPRTPYSQSQRASELPPGSASAGSSAAPSSTARRPSVSQTGSALGLHSASLPSFASSVTVAAQPPAGPRGANGPLPMPGFRPISAQSNPATSAPPNAPTHPRASQSPYGRPATVQHSPAGAFSRAPLPSGPPLRQASVSPALGLSSLPQYAGGAVRPSPPVRPVELGGAIPTGPKAMLSGLVPPASSSRPGSNPPTTPNTPSQALPPRNGWGSAPRGRGSGFGGPPSGPRGGQNGPSRGRGGSAGPGGGGWGWRGRGNGRGGRGGA